MEIKHFLLASCSLTTLRHIAETPIFQLTYAVMESYSKTAQDFCRAYGELCGYIFEHKDLSRLFYDALVYDNNIFADLSCKKHFEEIPEYIKSSVSFDIQVLETVSSITGDMLIEEAVKVFPKESAFLHTLPRFPNSAQLPVKDIFSLYELYKQKGYGYFARGTAFTVEKGEIVALPQADSIRLSDLKGYERQKRAILSNTLSFLQGKLANHILLYGDKGTGKSSTVKAVVNEYAKQGLKIIDLSMAQLKYFPKICEIAGASPFKFILFLDDLTFQQEDETFTALKAFIEGGVAGKPDNILIYATSNRRHLVKENMSDRMTENEIHLRDTMETAASLSDRFGLEITFSVPDKEEYLDIVDSLAEEYGIDLEQKELHMLAERFALTRGGRSPRTARQFIKLQVSEMAMES